MLAAEHRAPDAVVVAVLVALAGWTVLSASTGAAVFDGAGQRLFVVLGRAEVGRRRRAAGRGRHDVPAGPRHRRPARPGARAARCSSVPLGRLLLAGAPATPRWVAAGPPVREHRGDPVVAHRGLCHVTLVVIGLALGAVTLLGPTGAGVGAPAPAAATAHCPQNRVDAPPYARAVSDRHILTAVAWPYANGPRHIGHVSGFGVPSDVFSRYQRMAGNKVLMVSGTDEHGTPITVAADAEGVTPREIADRNNRIIVGDLASLGLSYDLFTRTTTANHAAVSQEIFLGLLKNGYVFPKTTLGAISPSTGRTLPDRYIEGTCPICGYDGARGDQCDNCGNQLDPIDLINPVSKINGETPKFVEEEHYFLDLPAFAKALGDWLDSRAGAGGPTS